MTTLAEFNASVDRILQDKDTKLSDANINSFIQSGAVKQYSKHKPKRRVASISASGSYDYTINITNFPSWVDDFSAIKSVEYPATNTQIPNIIPTNEWTIYEDASNQYLRFLVITPSSDNILVNYITPHSVPDTGAATIYTNDEEAFSCLAASYAAQALANWYVQSTDSTIGADAVNYLDKSTLWAARARSNLQKYIDYMFPKNLYPGMAGKEFDTIYSSLGLTRLTHPNWSR